MKTITTATAILLTAVSGCCGPRNGVEQFGLPPADGTDEVLQVAAQQCGRPLDGTVTWVATKSEVYKNKPGYCWFDDCGFDITIAQDMNHADQCWTLMHEFTHYCRQDSDHGPEFLAMVYSMAHALHGACAYWPEGD